MKMVVPGSAPIIQPDHGLGNELGRGSTENCVMGPDVEPVADQVGSELEEVRKLQELVRRLELQNQQLRTRSLRSLPEANVLSQAGTGVDNCNSRLNGMEINNSINTLMDKQELQIVADLHSALSKMRSEAEECGEFLKNDVDAVVQHSCASGSERGPSNTEFASNVEMQFGDADTNDVSNWDFDSTVLVEDFTPKGVEPVLRMSEESANVDSLLNETALDEVEVLELESGSVEDDSWLYVSPRKPPTSEKESPLKWCRQVLDNPSPETEAACRTLIGRLDQGSVQAFITSFHVMQKMEEMEGGKKSNHFGVGYLGMHSALSSQSSVDSELSTSDDSISMGYKLQDLTDVQVMARLQEESLRQDCASSSASVSRRSSSASLHSLRRGTYSDQDFDTYSLEDEDDDCSFSYHSNHRYSPSPLSSPRCQSPSTNTDYSRAAGTQIRPPRRTLQSPMQDRLKYSGNEEDLRHSMPNLARTDLAPSKLRFSSSAGQPALTVRQPMKAASCANSLLTSRPPVRAPGYASPAGRVRKLPSSTLNPGSTSGSSIARNNSMSGGAKHALPKGRTSVGGPSSLKSKLTQPAKRFPKASVVSVDDSWKDGCY
ncbi:hypothetical protein JD844_004415 [Phrynosoma platyrhinos]|uniref:SLAIN motif-containing protein-like n=1 Tax=Phrynosoma platyrhinos TaxID=52577 RepID=A0ABQ7TNE3_PHRPL|nr:hypothetical protein JD844_004415 [Phrynosoma platyrhinos]